MISPLLRQWAAVAPIMMTSRWSPSLTCHCDNTNRHLTDSWDIVNSLNSHSKHNQRRYGSVMSERTLALFTHSLMSSESSPQATWQVGRTGAADEWGKDVRDHCIDSVLITRRQSSIIYRDITQCCLELQSRISNRSISTKISPNVV